MRHAVGLFAAGLFAVGTAVPAGAVVLPFQGELFFGVGSLPGVTVMSASGNADVTVTGLAHVNAFNLAGATFVATARPSPFAPLNSVAVPNAAPISGVVFAGGTTSFHGNGINAPPSLAVFRITGSASNAPGAFGGLSGGGGGGVMPMNGVAVVCLFDICSGAPGAKLVVPLTPVGQGGTVFAAGQGGVNLTVIGAPWLGGTAQAGTVTQMGFGHGPVSGTTNTAQPSGAISLVVPVFVSTSLDAFPVVPVFTRLTLHFVPEPSTLLLLASGIAGLALVGRQRMKK
jgi:hypothetical protein